MLAWTVTSADVNLATVWGWLVMAFTLLPLLPLAVTGWALVHDLDESAAPAPDTLALGTGFHAHVPVGPAGSLR